MPKATASQLFEHALLLEPSQRAVLVGLLAEHLGDDKSDGIKAHLLIEGVTYERSMDRHRRHASGGEDLVFRFCSFEHVVSCGSLSSTFIGCDFDDCEWDYASITGALFIRANFNACTFRYTPILGCIFVECSFDNCSFLPDRLGREPSFEDTRWFACSASQCTGLAATAIGRASDP